MARWILWVSSAVLVGVAVLGLAGNDGGKFVRCELDGAARGVRSAAVACVGRPGSS